MTDEARTERLVREWLATANHPRSGEPVVEAILDSLPATSQESASRTGVVLRRLVNALAVAAVVVLAVVGIANLRPSASPNGARGTPAPTASPKPSSTSSVRPSPVGPSSAVPGVTAISMGADTWALAIDDRSVWVQVGDVGIGRIDRATNRDTGIRVNEVPQMQFEGSNLWALDIGTGIVRLDPLTGEVLRTIHGISGFYIAVDGSTAWVTDTGHSLDRVDLTTGKVIKSIDVPATPKEIVVFDGAVWVACDAGGSVARIDIATNKLVATIPAGDRPVNLAAGEGAVWVWNHQQQLLRIDPATNKVVATIDGVARTLGVGVAVGGGWVWVAMPGGIGRVDPATNKVVDVIPLGPGGYVDLKWYDGELWASSTSQDLVYRIDPSP
jgi:streptogramin lyase